jgi:hypothetical protein
LARIPNAMNLQALTIDDIPIGVPLPWPIVDHYGYTAFSRGEVITRKELLRHLVADGLLRDVDALPETAAAPDWLETTGLPASEMFPPAGIKPQIGERLQLRLIGRDARAFYLAHLIGNLRGRSVLVTLPEIAGQRIGMSEYGIEFRHLSTQDELWLRCLVYHRLAEGHRA